MKRIFSLFLFPIFLAGLWGCLPSEFREGKVFAGGKYVPARTLNKGKQIYAEYCMSCHGVKGDGKGVAAKGLATPPRNFTSGFIKFGDVVSGDLPHDESIYQSLKHGLNGTAMLPWDLKPGQMEVVWQYIKTFAPKVWEGEDKKLGEKITLTKDPFGLARKSSAIKLGRKVYHVTANCQSCHRAYVTGQEFDKISRELTGDPGEIDDEFYKLKLQDSDYGYMVTPPDFTFHRLRSIRGTSVDDIYLRLAAGVGGTTMPAWQGTIEDEEIWAVAYYVQHLMEMRNKPARKKLMDRLGQ